MEHESLVENLDRKLTEFVVAGAREILSEIVRKRTEDLVKRNPTFSELAEQITEILLFIEEEASSKDFRRSIFNGIGRLEEYAEILDSIAIAVSSLNEGLITDNITHLQEFVEINGKEKKHE